MDALPARTPLEILSREAQVLLERGEHEAAEEAFTRALVEAPRDVDLLYGRGLSRARMKQYPEAVEDLRRAAALQPRSLAVWRTLGQARIMMKQPVEAITDFDRALDLEKDDTDSLFGRGVARGDAGDFTGAERDFTRVLEINPGYALAWSNRGWARRRQGRPREAIDDLDRSLGIDDRNALAWSNRGYARQETGDVAGAAGDFEKALSLDPSLESELGPLIRKLRNAERPAEPPPPPVPPPAQAPVPAPPAGRPPALISSSGDLRAIVEFWGCFAVVSTILGILRIPILSDPFTRAMDLPCKIGWIALHISDSAGFPPSSNLCTEPFCMRTDTKKKYVTGRPGYTSEVRYHYCPAHEPGFLEIEGQTGKGLISFYWFLVVIVSGILLVPPQVVLFRILLWPWLLVLVILGRQPLRILVPTGDDKSTNRLDGSLSSFGFWVGLLILIASWVLFFWY